MEVVSERREKPVTSPAPEITTFTGKQESVLHTILAVAIWLGAIHFNVAIVIASFFFLSLPNFFASVFLFLSLYKFFLLLKLNH